MIPSRLDRKTVYDSDYIRLHLDRVQMPSGAIIEKYHQLEYPKDAVVVLLINTKQEVCLVQSLRYTTQSLEWELPAGGVEKGEDIVTAAQREVIEETGFAIQTLEHVYSYNPSNGMSTQEVHVLFGTIEDLPQESFDTDEVLTVHWFSCSDIEALLHEKQIRDGVSLVPLLLYLNRLKT